MIKNKTKDELNIFGISLVRDTLIQLGQTKSAEDQATIARILINDLQKDFSNMEFEDVQEGFRNGIRNTDEFVLNVKTYYKWLKMQKKILYENEWNKNNLATYREDKRVSYRSRKGTGMITINKLLK